MEETDRQKHPQMITRKLVSLTAGCIVLFFVMFCFIPSETIGRTFLVGPVFFVCLIGRFSERFVPQKIQKNGKKANNK